MKKLLVTGSRFWTDRDTMREALSNAHFDLLMEDSEAFDVLLVHGAARGADRMAKDIWKRELKQPVKDFPADWEKYGKAAGPIRNAEMVQYGADLCLAFPTDESVGTWDCVKQAARAGIKVIIFPERK